MHSIPEIHSRIQALAFNASGDAALLTEASKPSVPSIIGALPLLAARENRTDDENRLVRQMCETIIAAQWDWAYEGGGSSMALAIATLAQLPAPEVDASAESEAAMPPPVLNGEGE